MTHPTARLRSWPDLVAGQDYPLSDWPMPRRSLRDTGFYQVKRGAPGRIRTGRAVGSTSREARRTARLSVGHRATHVPASRALQRLARTGAVPRVPDPVAAMAVGVDCQGGSRGHPTYLPPIRSPPVGAISFAGHTPPWRSLRQDAQTGPVVFPLRYALHRDRVVGTAVAFGAMAPVLVEILLVIDKNVVLHPPAGYDVVLRIGLAEINKDPKSTDIARFLLFLRVFGTRLPRARGLGLHLNANDPIVIHIASEQINPLHVARECHGVAATSMNLGGYEILTGVANLLIGQFNLLRCTQLMPPRCAPETLVRFVFDLIFTYLLIQLGKFLQNFRVILRNTFRPSVA